MNTASTPDVHAGEVPCGPALYEVTDAIDHKTLKTGDLVRMVEDPHCNNWLLRTDNTLHALQGGQRDLYVCLRLATTIGLGPLPPAAMKGGPGSMTRHDHYTADQMHAYGRQERAAERKTCEVACAQALLYARAGT